MRPRRVLGLNKTTLERYQIFGLVVQLEGNSAGLTDRVILIVINNRELLSFMLYEWSIQKKRSRGRRG